MTALIKILSILGCGMAGGFIGYMAGAYVMCFWLWPESNLCGLLAVFTTGPLGALGGLIGGFLLFRRNNPPPKE